MSVLVTGGAGYIGSHMLLALLDAGEKAVALDNLSTGERSLVPDGVDFIEGDVGDENLIRKIIEEYRRQRRHPFCRVHSRPGVD